MILGERGEAFDSREIKGRVNVMYVHMYVIVRVQVHTAY